MAERPLKLLMVLQPPDGGAAEQVLRLSLGAAQAGHDVTVAGPAQASMRPRLEAAGLRFVALPIVGSMVAPKEDVGTLRRLSRLLAQGGFDLVHTHAQKAGVIGRVAALRAGVPALYTPHSFVYRTQLVRPRRSAQARFLFGRTVERALGRGSAAIVAVAEEERQAAIADSIAPPERVHTILNGVACDASAEPDRELLAFRGDGPLLGLVSTLRDQKGLPTLLDALELLHSRGELPRFAIVGNGPLWGEVRERLDAGPLGDRVLLLPFGDRVEPYLAALDAFVLPSYWEGLPLAVLEAMCMGLPVVASAVGGTPEAVIEGETGLLVEPGNVVALAERLATIAQDAEGRARMGRAAREAAQARFGIERMVSETLDLYGRVAATSVTGST